MKITVQSSNSNPVATDDTNIITILMFLDSTGVWMIVDTGEFTDVEVITTIIVWGFKMWALQLWQY